jgi:hypothetical protein
VEGGMSISTYAELKTALQNFSYRSDTDYTDRSAEFVALGEAWLNRELDAIETDADLTGVVDSRELDLSALAMTTPLSLFILDSTGNETKLTEKTDGDFAYSATSGTPRYWAYDSGGDHIDFDCPLSSAYEFRLHYIQRFALSDAVTTNWLLADHPDVYLAACMVWGCAFLQAFTGDGGANVQNYQTVLDSALPKLKRLISRNRTGLLSVDPGLLAPRRVNFTTLS